MHSATDSVCNACCGSASSTVAIECCLVTDQTGIPATLLSQSRARHIVGHGCPYWCVIICTTMPLCLRVHAFAHVCACACTHVARGRQLAFVRWPAYDASRDCSMLGLPASGPCEIPGRAAPFLWGSDQGSHTKCLLLIIEPRQGPWFVSPHTMLSCTIPLQKSCTKGTFGPANMITRHDVVCADRARPYF